MVDAVRLHLVAYFARGGECFGQVGEHFVHLGARLEPLLLGVEHAVGVVEVAPGGQADKAVVGFGVLFVNEVAVVGTDVLHAELFGNAQEFRVHLHLQGVGLAVGAHGRVFHLVALEFEVVVVAKHVFEPPHALLGLFEFALQYILWHFAAQTGGADNEPLTELFEVLVVGARTHIEAVDPGARNELHEVVVPLLVLCQHDEVPTGLVCLFLFERLVAATRHVHLAAEDGLEIGHGTLLAERGLAFGNEFVGGFALVGVLAVLAGLGFIRAVAQGLQLCLGILYDALGLARHLAGIVEEVLDAHHVAVVGDGHAAHSVLDGFVDELGHGGLAVEDGVLGVNV